jgi:lipoprotein-releasing system ATP-binding protein
MSETAPASAIPTAPPARPVILECQGLTRTFKVGEQELRVLKSVDFALHEGEIAGIVGASGAGKSTLLHLLGLLDTPTAGKILYRGENLAEFSPEAAAKVRNRDFGFVFQAFHLLPEFTALENVMMPARIGAGGFRWLTDAARIEKEARELLARVGLGERLNHQPTRLSGGERQRVALARALINRPAVMFCDEPTGNLDTRTADEIFSLIEEFNKERGLTILLVTHSETLASRAHRVLRMKDGVFV